VMSVPTGGGSVATLVAGSTVPRGIALDSNSVYWTDSKAGTVSKLAKP
jgi:hypothetical protein